MLAWKNWRLFRYMHAESIDDQGCGINHMLRIKLEKTMHDILAHHCLQDKPWKCIPAMTFQHSWCSTHQSTLTSIFLWGTFYWYHLTENRKTTHIACPLHSDLSTWMHRQNNFIQVIGKEKKTNPDVFSGSSAPQRLDPAWQVQGSYDHPRQEYLQKIK
jgi:hypothetical protein